MSLVYFLIGIVTLGMAIWLIGSYISINGLEEPRFSLILEEKWYEIRQYAPYIVAEVEVKGTYNEAINDGFRHLAAYIFWGNTTKESIEMTAPVIEKKSEKIRMTSPVIDIKWKSSSRTIQFTMPKEYTMESLPIPDDTRVNIREIPRRKMAAFRYTGWVREWVAETKKQELKSFIERDNYAPVWDFLSAQYNPPFSFPLMRRNEILVEIE